VRLEAAAVVVQEVDFHRRRLALRVGFELPAMRIAAM
jgi:hypothetical protein